MLFSEPKIPQSSGNRRCGARLNRFSALQRAENSSMPRRSPGELRNVGFQCSSASRKFLNWATLVVRAVPRPVSVLFSEPKIPQSSRCSELGGTVSRFSALQRAENSSIGWFDQVSAATHKFQCSSASRKFLNYSRSVYDHLRSDACFSALQRAENSSIQQALVAQLAIVSFSALQRAENSSIQR